MRLPKGVINTGTYGTIEECQELSDLQERLNQAGLELARMSKTVSGRCTEIAISHGLPKPGMDCQYGISPDGEFLVPEAAQYRLVDTLRGGTS